MADVEFKDFTIKVIQAMEEKAVIAVEEAAGEIESGVKRNTRVKTGKTKNSFTHKTLESELTSYVGSNDENAIWEEFGTGEHALNGNGRKGGWFYVDEEGNGHFTHGKEPSKAFWRAYTTLKAKIIKGMQERIKELSQ